MKYARYQTVTEGARDVRNDYLYEGDDLTAAHDAAVAYSGKCRIDYWRHDGTVLTVRNYKGGRVTCEYV